MHVNIFNNDRDCRTGINKCGTSYVIHFILNKIRNTVGKVDFTSSRLYPLNTVMLVHMLWCHLDAATPNVGAILRVTGFC